MVMLPDDEGLKFRRQYLGEITIWGYWAALVEIRAIGVLSCSA